MKPKILIAMIAIFFVSGCSTITRGTTEAFVIESDPPGAIASLSSGETCTTPCALTKKRRDKFTVKIEKAGYEPVEANISHRTAGGGAAGMAGNVILGGLIGAAVDAGTGSTQELVPNPLVVKLVPISKGMGDGLGGGAASNPLDLVIEADAAELGADGGSNPDTGAVSQQSTNPLEEAVE